MSDKLNLPYWANNPTAIEMLNAYQRIVTGSPIRVKKSLKVSLSSVSIEAGFHRSMLSKKRYPDLCRLIEDNKNSKINSHTKSVTEKLKIATEANRNLRSEISQLKDQAAIFRDQLIAAEQELLTLKNDLADLNQLGMRPRIVKT